MGAESGKTTARAMPLRHVITGTVLMLGVTLLQVVLAQHEPMTFERTVLILGIAIGSAFGMAAVLAPVQRYPQWAWFGSAGVLSLGLMISLLLATDPGTWIDALRPSLWMVPWFPLAMATSNGGRAADCAPVHPRTGWFLLGTSLLLGILILIVPVVTAGPAL